MINSCINFIASQSHSEDEVDTMKQTDPVEFDSSHQSQETTQDDGKFMPLVASKSSGSTEGISPALASSKYDSTSPFISEDSHSSEIMPEFSRENNKPTASGGEPLIDTEKVNISAESSNTSLSIKQTEKTASKTFFGIKLRPTGLANLLRHDRIKAKLGVLEMIPLQAKATSRSFDETMENNKQTKLNSSPQPGNNANNIAHKNCLKLFKESENQDSLLKRYHREEDENSSQSKATGRTFDNIVRESDLTEFNCGSQSETVLGFSDRKTYFESFLTSEEQDSFLKRKQKKYKGRSKVSSKMISEAVPPAMSNPLLLAKQQETSEDKSQLPLSHQSDIPE